MTKQITRWLLTAAVSFSFVANLKAAGIGTGLGLCPNGGKLARTVNGTGTTTVGVRGTKPDTAKNSISNVRQWTAPATDVGRRLYARITT